MEGTIGFVTPVGFNFAPKNWAYCNGVIMNIASNTALFSILGTSYGGNGTTTFGLPNLQGRVPVGVGQGPGLSPYSLGEIGGVETATLTVEQMPAHIHPVNIKVALPANTDSSNSDSPGNNYPGVSANLLYSSTSDTITNPFSAPSGGTITPTGSGTAFSILQPLIAINFVICCYGVYPSRN